MRVLCLSVPRVISYFNAGHHLPLFQVAAHLRAQRKDEVDAIDAAAIGTTWRDVCRLFARDYDVVAIMCDFDSVDTFDRLVTYARELAPASRLIAFGRLCHLIPKWFTARGVDAVVDSGDVETGVAAYLGFLDGARTDTPGVRRRTDEGFTAPVPGETLAAEEWTLPDVAEIPYDAYSRLYADDLNKFCGIPERQELVVPLARGCPVNCSYCDVPLMQGLSERRLTVDRTLAYIAECRARGAFEYVSFYAPTFTLKRRWVHEFCARYAAIPHRLPWKCVTTLAHLDEELVRAMGESGCVRISVGLETLDPRAESALPTVKRNSRQKLEAVAAWCTSAGVELNCFVILGLPGESEAGIDYTIEVARRLGARVRPTVYTPYEELRDDASVDTVARFNRQLLVGMESRERRSRVYDRLYRDRADAPTKVQERVASAEAAPAVAHVHPRTLQLSPREKTDYRGLHNLSSNEVDEEDAAALLAGIEGPTAATLSRYPNAALVEADVARAFDMPPDHVVLCPGTDAAIAWVMLALARGTSRVILVEPSYRAYGRYAEIAGVTTTPLTFARWDAEAASRLGAALDEAPPSVVAFADPHAFTGESLPPAALETLLTRARARGHLVVLDAAYADYAGARHERWPLRFDNVVVLRSLSKGWAIPAARVGVVFGAPARLEPLRRSGITNPIATPSLALLATLLERGEERRAMQARVIARRDSTREELVRGGAAVPVSAANFLFVDLGRRAEVERVRDRLRHDGIVVRTFEPGSPLENGIRFSIARPALLRRVVAAVLSVGE